MPIWVAVQLALLIGATVIGLLLLRSHFWKIGYPFKPGDALIIVFQWIVPSLWSVSSLAFGLYWFSHRNWSLDTTALLSLIMIPGAVIIFQAVRLTLSNRKLEKEESYENSLVRDAEKECHEWANMFPFLSRDNINVQVYVSNGRPAGRVTVVCISTDEANQLYKYQNNLPDGINLLVSPKSNDSKHC